MPTQVLMPNLGLTMEEGKLLRWLVGEGESVYRGQPLAELETDKLVAVIESPVDGILAQIIAAAGQTVAVAGVVGWIVAPGEELPGGAAPKGVPERAASVAQRPEGAVASARAPVRKHDGRIRASPIARKVAREAGLDLATVRGSGPGGRVVLVDVRAAIGKKAEGVPALPAIPRPAGSTSSTAERVTIPSGVRRVIAERMSESHRASAGVTLVTEADATELVRLRQHLKAEAERRRATAISYTDILIKVVASNLRQHPALNARLLGEEVQLLPDINVGVAVDTERGLLVTVVRDAQRKSLLEVSHELRGLAARARSGTSLPADLAGGTFTVTNLGMYEIDAFTPVINLPECAILGVGRIVEKPAVRDGQIVARAMVTLSLTFDHRIVDGAPAARFLQDLKRAVENPAMLL